VEAGAVAEGTPANGTRSHGPATVAGLGASDPRTGPSAVDPPPTLPHPAVEAGGDATEHEVPPPDDVGGVANNEHPSGGAGGAANLGAPDGGAGSAAGGGIPSGAAGGGTMSWSQARAQPSTAPDPNRGR
jgi:hypothetical protein